MSSQIKSRHPFNLYVTAGEYMKVIGTQDGYFPDFGHHVANEMGGVWLHPIKLLDGFWLRITDLDRNISVWSRADEYVTHPWGNVFRYDHGLGHIPISAEREQFVPDREKGFICRYKLFNYSSTATRLKLELLARTDLRPVWHSESIGIVDGKEDVLEKISDRLVLAKDSDHEWYTLIGSDLSGQGCRTGDFFGPEVTAGNGTSVSFDTVVTLEPQASLTFRLFVAGSCRNRQECERTYASISADHKKMYEEKKRVCQAVKDRADLEVEGEALFNETFAWMKWNTQWLVQTVDGFGRGLTAGSPTYPWWFGCDNSYSLQGVLSIGDHQLAKDTAKLILDASLKENGNGRIIHEVTTMGAVSNPGNTQETAHFIFVLWEIYRWTGDRGLLEEYYEYCLKGIDWLLGDMDPDGDLFPSGYGIIEIAGLNMEMIDSSVYAAKAVQAASFMCEEMGDKQKAQNLANLSTRMIQSINEKYWHEREGLFCDAVAPKKDLLPKVDHMVSMAERHDIPGYRAYLERILAEAGNPDEDRGWLINKNWVIVTPMEAGIAEGEKGRRAIRNMRNDEFIGEYGSYLSGTFRQAVMTINTGVHAVAEAKYGDADASLDLLKRMCRTFSKVLPGSMSEMSPDYGCVVQAWTVYAMAVPVIMHYIGLQPEAHRNRMIIQPNIPSSWEGKWIHLRNALVGQSKIDISVKTEGGRLTAKIRNDSRLEVILSWNGNRVTSSEADIALEI